MGLLLSQAMMNSFTAEVERELVKEAISLNPLKWLGIGAQKVVEGVPKTPGFFARQATELPEALSRVLSPRKGLQRSMEAFSPGKAVRKMTGAEQEKYFKPGWFGIKPGEHLKGESKGLISTLKGAEPGAESMGGRARMAAEELSRRGWTGRGKYTKYVPIGAKSGLAGWTLPFAVPDIQEAYGKDTGPTGEGGLAETIGSHAGGLGGFALSGGLGLPSMLGLSMLGSGVGGRLGKIVDRLRGGASLPTAAMAPTPTEAASNLEDIQRYYG